MSGLFFNMHFGKRRGYFGREPRQVEGGKGDLWKSARSSLVLLLNDKR